MGNDSTKSVVKKRALGTYDRSCGSYGDESGIEDFGIHGKHAGDGDALLLASAHSRGIGFSLSAHVDCELGLIAAGGLRTVEEQWRSACACADHGPAGRGGWRRLVPGD